MTAHVLWPEGLPGKARRTTSKWMAIAILARMQMTGLFPLPRTRRIRHSRCEEGMPDPYMVEAALEDAGAIPPPGGWPRPRPSVEAAVDAPRGDVHTTTHAVI